MFYFYSILSFLSILFISGYSTIYIEDYPDTYEDFMPGQGDGSSEPSQQQVEQSMPTVQENAVWGEVPEQTPQGTQEVQVFGVDPGLMSEPNPPPQGN